MKQEQAITHQLLRFKSPFSVLLLDCDRVNQIKSIVRIIRFILVISTANRTNDECRRNSFKVNFGLEFGECSLRKNNIAIVRLENGNWMERRVFRMQFVDAFGNAQQFQSDSAQGGLSFCSKSIKQRQLHLFGGVLFKEKKKNITNLRLILFTFDLFLFLFFFLLLLLFFVGCKQRICEATGRSKQENSHN